MGSEMCIRDRGTLLWGDETSPLTLAATWSGGPNVRATPLQLSEKIDIASRRGCDLFPVNISKSARKAEAAKLGLGRYARTPRAAIGGAGHCR